MVKIRMTKSKSARTAAPLLTSKRKPSRLQDNTKTYILNQLPAKLCNIARCNANSICLVASN